MGEDFLGVLQEIAEALIGEEDVPEILEELFPELEDLCANAWAMEMVLAYCKLRRPKKDADASIFERDDGEPTRVQPPIRLAI